MNVNDLYFSKQACKHTAVNGHGTKLVQSRLCLMAVILCLIVSVFLFISVAVLSAEEYSFNLDEIEKKTFEWGGYGELKFAHSDLNRDGIFYFLNNYKNKGSTLDRVSSILQLEGDLNRGEVTFNWRLQAGAWQDNLNRDDSFDVFEAFASFKPAPAITVNAGKKSFKWGKGYAWSPAAFIDRIRDPNNPEDALEGFTAIECDLIKSFTSHLQTIALTGVILPVYKDINGDFGEPDNINLAAKLYLLYRNTDIDFIFYTGNSRSTRYGIDFSKNIAANFEIHGELAYIPEQAQKISGTDGTAAVRTISDTSYLLGLRYLSETDVTTIAEFYHNGHGYTEDQLTGFFQFADDGYKSYLATGSDTSLQKAYNLSRGSYGKPQAGRNYLYTRISIKEPCDILYFTPAVTMIANVEDHSYSVSPEVMYTGITNFEMRLKFSFLNGGNFSEYGEKTNNTRLELRLRYFF